MNKKCCECQEEKALEEFYKTNYTKSGVLPQCKMCILKRRKIHYEKVKDDPCNASKKWIAKNKERYKRIRRKATLWHNYRITPEHRDQMSVCQDNKCAICGNEPGIRCSRECLVVDHNHVTGQVRDLLCSKCNVAVGMMEENIDYILNMAEYLMDHESKEIK